MKRLISDPGNSIEHIRVGYQSYQKVLNLQSRLMDLKKDGLEDDFLLTVEHPHTYTIGSAGSKENLLVNDDYLNRNGIDLHFSGRGGDITYHGPGQLVIYPILDLNHYYKDLHRYLRDLEEVIIRTLRKFDIDAVRIDGLTGVWVGERKLASIGIRMSKWITMHGTALNVSPDLTLFDNIIPCGIKDKSVSSISEILDKPVYIKDVIPEYLSAFSKVFGVIVNENDNTDYSISSETVTNLKLKKVEKITDGD